MMHKSPVGYLLASRIRTDLAKFSIRPLLKAIWIPVECEVFLSAQLHPLHTTSLFTYLVEAYYSIWRHFNMASNLRQNSSASKNPPPSVPEKEVIMIPAKSKLQYELSTEMLQAIFFELDRIDDAKAITSTCRRMHDAYKGYDNPITWAILARELEPALPGTLGALAIFVSPRKGPVDEPLRLDMDISARYWAPMLEQHGDLARRLVTLRMAVRMLIVYREVSEALEREPREERGRCSACVSSQLAERDWNPRNENTVGNCVEHLLQANAVRLRLSCRMVLDYKR